MPAPLIMLIDKSVAKLAGVRYQGPSPTKVQFAKPGPMVDPSKAQKAKEDPANATGGVKQLPPAAGGKAVKKSKADKPAAKRGKSG